MRDNDLKHCVDCCCARSWEALGINKHTGFSIPDHIEQLRSKVERLEKQRDYLAGEYTRLENTTDIIIRNGYREPWTKEDILHEARVATNDQT